MQASQPWPVTTSAALAPWRRNERSPLAGLKTTSYGENAVMLAWAKERGFSEALLANLAGDLCEGTGSNVFVVVEGRILTPTLRSGCLAGVTRALVLEWCGAFEQDIPADALPSVEELFITSSTREIHPVDRVGDRRLPFGPMTRAALETFRAQARRFVDP